MSFDIDKTRGDHKTVGINHLNDIVTERMGDCGYAAGCRQ